VRSEFSNQLDEIKQSANLVPYRYNRIHTALSVITEHTVEEQMASVA
jgi:hypothetical protein